MITDLKSNTLAADPKIQIEHFEVRINNKYDA